MIWVLARVLKWFKIQAGSWRQGEGGPVLNHFIILVIYVPKLLIFLNFDIEYFSSKKQVSVGKKRNTY